MSEWEPGIKGGWRGEERLDYMDFVGHKMEFGLFSKIDVKLLRSLMWRSDLIRVTFLKAHSAAVQSQDCGGSADEEAGGGGWGGGQGGRGGGLSREGGWSMGQAGFQRQH